MIKSDLGAAAIVIECHPDSLMAHSLVAVSL
jgi:hypothetical protein